MHELRPIPAELCEKIAIERNKARKVLRTPGLTTQAEQEKFFLTYDRRLHHFYALWDDITEEYFGVCGLCNLEWENSRAEISLLIFSEYTHMGYGRDSLKILLKEGFGNMSLKSIYGECYTCNPACGFWKNMIAELKENSYKIYTTEIPYTKRWDGEYYGSIFFVITEDV